MSPVLKLILRRVGLAFLTLALVSILVFVATQALPGDAARMILGKEATPDAIAALRSKLHLDQSLPAQYGHWIAGIIHFDPGRSLASGEPVTSMLSTRVLNSAFLVVVSALIAIPISLALGVFTAVRRDRASDTIISTVSLVLAALPEFVIGIGLVLLFATAVLQVLPAVSLVDGDGGVWTQPNLVILPAATLVLSVTPYISRIMRGSMIEVLESDYVQMARLKGMSRRTVLLRHAVPNALVPAIQVSALQLAWMAGGVVTVEFVFSFPGIGSALVDAVAKRDIVVVQAITLLVAAVYVVLNLVADLLSLMVTPKVRTALR